MNTKTAWIAVAVILLLAFAWYASSAQKAAAPANGAAAMNEPASQEIEDRSATDSSDRRLITLTNTGFSPARTSIQTGETIRFVNQSSGEMWVATDEHPTHTAYDNTTTREHCADGSNTNSSFDQCQKVGAGGSWEYTFTKQGTFGFHNHVGASHVGTIIVE